ncbi:MAG TPA: iron ABC transporter permease [Kofleriaceae bacterium]|jgi:iron complex transport system permease protein
MSGFVSGAGKRVTAARMIAVLGTCAVVTAAVALLAPLVGTAPDGHGAWHHELLGLGALDPGSTDHAFLMLRLPRVLVALLVGGALAGAGCALQALLRNPLAEPFTLGISSGASFAAVLAIRLGAEHAFGSAGVGGAALLGSAATLAGIWWLTRAGGQLPPATLVLAGVTLSMFCSSANVLVQSTSDFAEVNHMLRWMMGGLEDVPFATVRAAAPPILAGLALLVLQARALDALAAGPDVAASLGVNVGRVQLAVFALSSLLVGVAIACVGPIGFVGLIVPHALRSIIGADHRLLLPASILGGGVLLVLCDTIARSLIPLDHLPTGAVTAVLGGPFFVGLLIRQKRRAGLWR